MIVKQQISVLRHSCFSVKNFPSLIKCQSYHHKETSQLICFANQLTGFFMMATVGLNIS